MKIGTVIRNMGEQATRNCIIHCAQQAESSGLDHVWTVDHIAIPPDDAEGSLGRYLDPLATLAFLAAITDRIGIGVSVLILPYRPALPTLKWIATIQELSGGRLLFGVGCGWMPTEFKALGVNRKQRGVITDQVLDLFKRCFSASDDIAMENGQSFLFRPNPKTPPVYVGGMNEPALKRAVNSGDGWIPVGLNAPQLEPKVARLRELAQEAQKSVPDIIVMGRLPDTDTEAEDVFGRLQELGASQYVQTSRYADEHAFDSICERLVRLRKSLSS